MTKIFSKCLKRYVGAVILLGALAASAWAAFVFLVPHAPGFAPEIGPRAAFLAFLIMGSISYFFFAVLVGVAVLVSTSSPERDA